MTDTGYDEWLDALGDGDGYYLECDEGHGSLPPRRVCPHCGSPELSREPLSDTGTVETYTVVHVPAPSFTDEAPYATAIADFDAVRVTGVVRGDTAEEIEVGATVEATAGENRTTGDRIVAFRPR